MGFWDNEKFQSKSNLTDLADSSQGTSDFNIFDQEEAGFNVHASLLNLFAILKNDESVLGFGLWKRIKAIFKDDDQDGTPDIFEGLMDLFDKDQDEKLDAFENLFVFFEAVTKKGVIGISRYFKARFGIGEKYSIYNRLNGDTYRSTFLDEKIRTTDPVTDSFGSLLLDLLDVNDDGNITIADFFAIFNLERFGSLFTGNLFARFRTLLGMEVNDNRIEIGDFFNTLFGENSLNNLVGEINGDLSRIPKALSKGWRGIKLYFEYVAGLGNTQNYDDFDERIETITGTNNIIDLIKDMSSTLLGKFAALDTNNDGKITFKEFIQGITGSTPVWAQKIDEIGNFFYDSKGDIRTLKSFFTEMLDKIKGNTDNYMRHTTTTMNGLYQSIMLFKDIGGWTAQGTDNILKAMLYMIKNPLDKKTSDGTIKIEYSGLSISNLFGVNTLFKGVTAVTQKEFKEKYDSISDNYPIRKATIKLIAEIFGVNTKNW